MNSKPTLVILIITLLVLGTIVYIATQNSPTGPALLDKTPASVNLESLAQCLKDRGVVFYGAFWCPHCQNQKALFGKAEKLLPYVECSTPDGKEQTPLCKERKIEGYPTWEFPPQGTATSSTRLSGEVSLEQLSLQSSCPLYPPAVIASSTVPIVPSPTQ